MKKLFAAMAIFAMVSVQAEELKFGDLNYFIPVGNFNLSAAVDYRSDQFRTVNQVTETEGWYLSSLLTYGFSNKLNLFVGLPYQFGVDVIDETDTTNDRYSEDGLGNPIVGGIYRLFDQGSNDFNFDLGALGRIKVMDSERGDSAGTQTKDGNAAASRNSVDIFGRLGKKWNEANEWQATVGFVQYFAGEYTVRNVNQANSKFDDDASTDLYVRAAYQYRPVNEFMMVLTAQATQIGEREVQEKSTNVKTEYDSHLDWDINFTAKYLITSNFIGRFNYGLGRNPDFDGKTNGANIEVDRRRESTMGLGVDWLF